MKWRLDESITADISQCGTYRNFLLVTWRLSLPELAVIGLNPSKADLQRSDNTMRKCVNWAKGHGYGSLLMLNCYPFRATDPSDMRAAVDPFGGQTLACLTKLCSDVLTVVAAWGGQAKHLGRGDEVARVFNRAGIPLFCFGINQDGSPLHPCYAKLPDTLLSYGGCACGR